MYKYNIKNTECYNLTDLKLAISNSKQEWSGKTFLRPFVRKIKNIIKIINPYENLVSHIEVGSFFAENFLKIAHPYGITLSVDEIGSSCQIAQNSTLGTNGKFQSFDESTPGYKPRLGHLVKVNPGAIISGPVEIGHCVIVSAGSIVTKNIPSFKIVRGVNEIFDLQEHHYKTFLHILHQQLIIAKLPTLGVIWQNGLYTNSNELTEVNKLFKSKYPDIDETFIDFLRNKLSCRHTPNKNIKSESSINSTEDM
jgi:serine acetyltransferase